MSRHIPPEPLHITVLPKITCQEKKFPPPHATRHTFPAFRHAPESDRENLHKIVTHQECATLFYVGEAAHAGVENEIELYYVQRSNRLFFLPEGAYIAGTEG